MTPLRIALLSIGGLVVAAIIFVIVVVILVFVGGPDLEAKCGEREIDVSDQTETAFDDKWDAFDAAIGAGRSAAVDFDEAELTQRAQTFLSTEDVEEIKEVTICLFADGTGEGKGKVDVPGLPDISAKIRGRITLDGDVPKFEIDDFDVGTTGFLVDVFGAEGEVERAVNEALEKVDLRHPPYRVEVDEGVVRVAGP